MANNRFARIADNDASKVSNEKLKISFEYLDWESEEFFFHGMEVKYYRKFFSCITEIKASTEKDITTQTHPSLSPKSIFNNSNSIRDSFPHSIFSILKQKLLVQTREPSELEALANEIISRAFEITLSKNYGRLHGFIWNNTFHIVWFDPAHNLYPMGKKIKKHEDAATVKSFSPEENLRLQEQIRTLQSENEELLEAFAQS